jgi:sugar/nucleoside kinase (ribokinase family)
VNTVASGDAFLGGLLCAALRKLDAPEALRWGAAAGAANAASSGGARFSRSSFEAIRQNIPDATLHLLPPRALNDEPAAGKGGW